MGSPLEGGNREGNGGGGETRGELQRILVKIMIMMVMVKMFARNWKGWSKNPKLGIEPMNIYATFNFVSDNGELFYGYESHAQSRAKKCEIER